MSPERTKARKNFVRLAEARTVRILKDLDLLANLANRSNYSYKLDEINKIFRAIRSKVQETEQRFDVNIKKDKKPHFKLDE